jgi:hypothetical protein
MGRTGPSTLNEDRKLSYDLERGQGFRCQSTGRSTSGAAPSAPSPYPGEREMAMTKHKFTAGDRVELLPDRLNTNVRPGVYTIVRAMPVTNLGPQYRAKSVMDSHERVFDEAQLRSV